ncbi:hypothetical protein ACWFMI_22160 [Nocardiopsis terrae]
MNAHPHTPNVQVPATGTSTTDIPTTRTPNADTPATRAPNRPQMVLAGRTDELVAEITGVLNHPGRPAHAARTLARADRLFSELDHRIRSGEPLPGAWLAARRPAPPPSRRGIAYEYATQCYDSVSEALREVGGVVVAWRALREAARAWERLDRALIERSPLPEPWLRE